MPELDLANQDSWFYELNMLWISATKTVVYYKPFYDEQKTQVV